MRSHSEIMEQFILTEPEKRAEIVGGKAANLAVLQELGYLVPSWLVVTPDAFYASLSEEHLTVFKSADVALKDIQRVIETIGVSESLERHIAESAKTLSTSQLFAVRSSALEEDGAKHSFAGQLDSYLEVQLGDVAATVAKVWRSAFSRRIIAYRQLNGLPLLPKAPAVIVQLMIQPQFAGVSFNIDPVSGDRATALVCSTSGNGEKLVSGEVDGNTYRVKPDGSIIESTITQQGPADAWVSKIADSVREISKQLKSDQDVEWALHENKLYMLQTRPITSMSPAISAAELINEHTVPHKNTRVTIWDNSNIGESYPGVTTPLTFSFARKAYQNVYLTFCQFMGVSAKNIKANQQVFPNMIGLLKGRIYYNLVNWYRLLSILPGYRSNKPFMEQMMGLKEPLPDYAIAEIAPEESHGLKKVADSLSLIGSMTGVAFNCLTLSKQMKDFDARFADALASVQSDLSHKSLHELATLYRALEERLLSHWDAPLTNDFFAMIFYGLLRKMTETLAENDSRFCGLYNDLLCGQSGIISTEPTRMMREMAQIAASHSSLAASLVSADLLQVVEEISKVPQFEVLYNKYLDRFGDRCLEELKLESTTLHDDPLPLLRNVGYLANRNSITDASELDSATTIRNNAEKLIAQVLQKQPTRLASFRFVLTQARNRVRDRENLRFKRTQLFGTVRRIFKAIALRFQSHNLIESVDDIFYLEVEEVLGLIEGTSSTLSIKELIAARKVEFSTYRNEPAPPSRIESSDIPQLFELKAAVKHRATSTKSDAATVLRGLGCCAGTITAPVRVVLDPRTATPLEGEILVADRTDPGWIVVFGQALGMIVEHGSLLSHTAIVARELGIPAAVSVAGAVTTLKTGDWVCLDGSTGEVTIVEPPSSVARITNNAQTEANTVIQMHGHPSGDRAHA